MTLSWLYYTILLPGERKTGKYILKLLPDVKAEQLCIQVEWTVTLIWNDRLSNTKTVD